MRERFWILMCDLTSRLYFFCCKRLWVVATGQPIPEGTPVVRAGVLSLVKAPANDNATPEEAVQAIVKKWNN